MKAVWESLVRTFTPIVVGAVLGWFATAGINLDSELEASLTLLVSGVFSGIYYVVARLLETYVTPKFGWLLGLAKTPSYEKPISITPIDADAQDRAVVQSTLTVDEVGKIRLDTPRGSD